MCTIPPHLCTCCPPVMHKVIHKLSRHAKGPASEYESFDGPFQVTGRWLPDRKTSSVPPRPTIERRDGRTRRLEHLVCLPSHSLAGLRWDISSGTQTPRQADPRRIFQEKVVHERARSAPPIAHMDSTGFPPVHPQVTNDPRPTGAPGGPTERSPAGPTRTRSWYGPAHSSPLARSRRRRCVPSPRTTSAAAPA